MRHIIKDPVDKIERIIDKMTIYKKTIKVWQGNIKLIQIWSRKIKLKMRK